MPNWESTLIGDLEDAVGRKKIGERAEVLRRITDLFMTASGTLSEEQIALFDQIMKRLVQEVDLEARARFSQELATRPDAPPETIHELALDDSIEVAGVVLSSYDRIDDRTLIESAETKSQAHLLAISRRKRLNECVTDVLVFRGNNEVTLTVVRNQGAVFSEAGYVALVQKSAANDELALRLWERRGIPRAHLVKLFTDASESLKAKLVHKDPGNALLIMQTIAQASEELQRNARESSLEHAKARENVQSLHSAGHLDEAHLLQCAMAGKFDETAMLLSHICDLPIALTERALVDARLEHIMIMSKAAGFAWDTVRNILELKAKTRRDALPDLQLASEAYSRLGSAAAIKTIQFYKLRARATESY